MSTEGVVVDASVALAFLREEIHTPRVRATIADWASRSVALVVPSHFWLEVTNALIRRRAFSTAQAAEGLLALDGLGLQTVETDRPQLLLAMDQMAWFGLSAYDAVYLALARSTGASLATLDVRLAAAAGDLGLLLSDDDPHRLSEDAASYQSPAHAEPGWAHSAVVGAEIARLRRELAAPSGG